MAVTIPTLSESYYPADQSEPVLDTTVGGILRDAAQAAPDQPALVGGHPGSGERRRWTYASCSTTPSAVPARCSDASPPASASRSGRPTSPSGRWWSSARRWPGLTLVTVNPAYKPGELKYVLEQSGSAGIFLLPEFRGNPMAQSLETVRDELPGLREAIAFTDFEAFLASGHADAKRSPTSARTTRSRSSTRRARPASPRARCCTTAG